MDAKDKLKLRHTLAKTKLLQVSKNKLPDGRISQMEAEIGARIGISGQTVRNYIGGNCKDGYTTEALISEFRKLKTAK